MAPPLARPIIIPGVARRMWQRVWPAVCFYLAAAPADTARGYADNFGRPVHENFTGVAAIAFSTQPTHWLQDLLLGSHAIQMAATEIYMSWFLIPITAAIPVLLYRPEHYPRFILYLLVTYFAVMPIFFLYPLQPPWMQDGGIVRVVTNILPQAAGRDSNPFAAMPSLHVALPLSAALWYGWRYPYGKIMFGYAALIAFVIVFTGDHYVTDILGRHAALWRHLSARQEATPSTPA